MERIANLKITNCYGAGGTTTPHRSAFDAPM